jgi:hypothetical protein
MEARGEPIVTATCYCQDCQSAGHQLGAILGRSPLEDDNGTEFVLVRKDWVRCFQGQGNLLEHRLNADTKTRRVVAGCCNTPMFLDFSGGHWLSLYRGRFAQDDRPALDMRIMTKDRPSDAPFPDAVPTYPKNSIRFIVRLMGAWAAMGFRTPRIDYVQAKVGAASR